MPNSLDLPSTFFPNARGLLPGRAVSVYRGHHPPTRWPEHWHDELQIVVHLDPSACTFKWKEDSGWQQKTVREPVVWIVRGRVRHEVILEEPCDLVVFYLENRLAEDIVGAQLPDAICLSLGEVGARDVLLIQLTTALHQICRDDDPSSALYVESIGTVFAEHVLRGFVRNPGKRNRGAGLSPEGLLKVTRYIDQHLGHHLDSATLARLVGKGRSQFIRRFKRSLGLTPRDYVMHRRTVKAIEMLARTDLKVTVIAERCGFSDDTHLGRWVRRIRGQRAIDVRAEAR